MIIQVSSHRRSGTHALIDLIGVAFSTKGVFYHLEDIIDWPLEMILENTIIVKTHEPQPRFKMSLFVDQMIISKEKAIQIEANTRYIHAYRHPKDVLKSLYYFNLKGHEPDYAIPETISFVEFLKQEGVQDARSGENRISFWERTVRRWVFSKDVLSFNYDEITNNQTDVIDKISFNFGFEKKKVEQERASRSSAIGRETTLLMERGALWTLEADLFYQSVVDENLLADLGLQK